jgi:hypothetical protein
MEADGFLETSAYTFHDSGKDPITEKERSIPIYNQIDDIDLNTPEAIKELQNICFEESADGFLIIGQGQSDPSDSYDIDLELDLNDTVFCRIELKGKHYISYVPVKECEDYSTFDLDELVAFKKYTNKDLPKQYAKILPINREF